uniref:Uncharacterized protein n=1 Tax=Laurencia snackeyi TaxID=1858662 RepID=A0A0G4KBL3_9FLOR|nr:Hypothetical protein orf269 [Laurencia snackeyi]
MIYKNNFFITKYSYSPITQYHKIKTSVKVYCVFGVLLFAPYILSNQIINCILILFLVIEINTFRELLYSYNLKKVQFIVSMIYYIISINQRKIYKYTNLSYRNKQLSRLKLAYFLKISWMNLNKNTINLKQCFILCNIPNYVSRIISVYIMLNSAIKILYLCTKYESALEVVINSLNKTKKKFQLHCKDYMIHLCLGYVFLQELAICLININFGVQIKNINLVNQNKYNLDLTLIKYLMILVNNQIHYSLILWNRNVLYANFEHLKVYN